MSSGDYHGNGGRHGARTAEDRDDRWAGQAGAHQAHAGAGPDTGPSVAEMLSALTTDATLLMRQEVELAKAEVRAEAKRAAKGAGMLSAAAVVGHLALLLLSFALAWGLAAVMQPGLAFLIVGLVYAAVATVLAAIGRQRLGEARTVPEQTVESVKEDVEWARDRIR